MTPKGKSPGYGLQEVEVLLDAVLENQKALEDHLRLLEQAVLAPREIIRDEKGRAKGYRIIQE